MQCTQGMSDAHNGFEEMPNPLPKRKSFGLTSH